MSISIDLVHEKSTKNTERYLEEVEYGQTAVIGTLYIQKSTFADEGKAPEKITAQVEW